MATKLKNMKLTSVDLVRAGANQEADICLFKSADPPEAPESPTEEEKNIFKRFIDWIRKNPTEAEPEPHSPIEKADEAPDLEYIYKSALAESLHSIMQDDTLTEIEKKDMAEESILQYSEKIRELNGEDEEAMEEEVQEEYPDEDERFDELEEVHKFNPHHGADGKFSSGGGGGGAAPAAGGGKGNMSNEDVQNNVAEGLSIKDTKPIKAALSDIRQGDSVTISAKTYKGSVYETKMTSNGDGSFRHDATIKGRRQPSKTVNLNDAADEMRYFTTMTQGARPKITVTRKAN